MSQNDSDTDRSDPAEESAEAPPDESAAQDTTTREMNELLGELRAEVTRLKAEQAKKQAESWVQRRPFLAVALSTVMGAAVGYGAAVATRSQPPSLSEQARRRLRGLADEARRVATDVGKDLSDRAARSSTDVRKRARETGQRLAKKAQERGKGIRKQAGDLARQASERARHVGAEAGETVRRATADASEEAREFGEGLAKEAEEAIEEQAESVEETLSGDEGPSTFRQSLYTIAGLTVGGYLAAKLRRWW